MCSACSIFCGLWTFGGAARPGIALRGDAVTAGCSVACVGGGCTAAGCLSTACAAGGDVHMSVVAGTGLSVGDMELVMLVISCACTRCCIVSCTGVNAVLQMQRKKSPQWR